MNWLLYALASTITFTVITALDKILIARFTPNPRTFIVLVGLTQFILAIVVTPWVVWTGYGAIDIAVAIISGIASGGYLVLMFWVMGQQDVSRVIPVTSTYPIFVAVLAFLFLGETIGLLAWVGIIVTVAGACLMSLGPTVRADQDRSGEKLAFALLVVASLGFGLSQFFSEVVEDDMTLWTLFFWRAIGNGAACVGFMIRPSGIPDLLSTLRRPKSVGLILLTEGVLVFVALFFLLWSIYTGPVSLVSTVAATRPLFVFGLGVLLSIGAANILDEPLEGKVLLVKLAATAMTVGGVITVTISQTLTGG